MKYLLFLSYCLSAAIIYSETIRNKRNTAMNTKALCLAVQSVTNNTILNQMRLE
jgi:hypothetical protein